MTNHIQVSAVWDKCRFCTANEIILQRKTQRPSERFATDKALCGDKAAKLALLRYSWNYPDSPIDCFLKIVAFAEGSNC
jgi:hypothetical protein